MENNKNEFDDIILEKSNKNEKIKKILLRVIALVILFLVVMIVMKLINSDENTEQLTPPSEPVATETPREQDNNGFENMPITENNNPEDQFDLLRKQLQNEENNESSQTQTEPIVNTETQTPLPPETQEPVVEQTPPPPSKQETNKPKQEVVKPKTEPTKSNVVKESPKKETNPKDLFKNVESVPTHSSGLAMGMYVQIFSVSNLDQKSKELANVKAKGYDYKLFKTTVNGKEITKVLIGPFEKDKIANELAKIRQEIAKDAFSFTLK
ncbi:SPOR domain-containing protein [Campylobacter helveticus]|uniref:SPOR domain-containing protein n=1 Tax=Campylobacter helveticus TaxID=28898 RepID=UPI0022EB73D7|nr:SPOR domain-containing protein [Campylobacter helveticus]